MTAVSGVPRSRPLELVGSVGALEAQLEEPAAALQGVAVLCHPHPLHGGTMSNKVVTTLARTLARLGVASVRFNFRGVGASAGSYDDGPGELADAVTAIDWAVGTYGPALPLVIGGFSFGGAIAYRAATVRSCRTLITVAPAVQRLSAISLRPGIEWLLVQGGVDEIVAPSTVTAWLETLGRAPTKQVWLPGVGHFFHGQLDALARTVAEFVQSDDRVA